MLSPSRNGFYARLETWFMDYVSSFDHSDPQRRSKFDLKREHSRMVAGETAAIARAIGLAPDAVALARVVGLLHDIGRFPQVAQYSTFDDRVSLDHGELGAALTRGIDLLAPLDGADRSVIEAAVRHHNKARLPELTDGRCRLFSQLVRDADKLDIFRVIREKLNRPGLSLTAGLPPGTDVSSEVLEDINTVGVVHKDHIRNRVDWVFFRIGWLFDINFAPTLASIQDRGYYAMLRSLLPQTERIHSALARVDDFLEG